MYAFSSLNWLWPVNAACCTSDCTMTYAHSPERKALMFSTDPAEAATRQRRPCHSPPALTKRQMALPTACYTPPRAAVPMAKRPGSYVWLGSFEVDTTTTSSRSTPAEKTIDFMAVPRDLPAS